MNSLKHQSYEKKNTEKKRQSNRKQLAILRTFLSKAR